MTTIVRRNQNWLPSMFDELFGNEFMPQRTSINIPAINIKENERQYTIEVAAPGMTKEDFSVRIDEENNLVINLEKREEKTENCNCDSSCECGCQEGKECTCDDKQNECRPASDERYLRREFSYSKFQRTMILPDDVDKDAIKARVEHGVLTIALPKYLPEQAQKSQRSIEIA